MKPAYFEILSPDEIVQIDKESKRMLAECGIKVLHEQCLEILEGAGCLVDRETSIVRMPPDVVQKAIDTTPETFCLYGRDP